MSPLQTDETSCYADRAACGTDDLQKRECWGFFFLGRAAECEEVELSTNENRQICCTYIVELPLNNHHCTHILFHKLLYCTLLVTNRARTAARLIGLYYFTHQNPSKVSSINVTAAAVDNV